MRRKATAVWKGTGLEGQGTLSTKSGVFDKQPYSHKLRFKNEDDKLGTNPEELIAAAHAGCFAMALSFQLNNAGFTADELHTDATVHLEQVDGGFGITRIELKLEGKVPGIDTEKFLELANNAKEGCPVSNALSAVPIELDSKLV